MFVLNTHHRNAMENIMKNRITFVYVFILWMVLVSNSAFTQDSIRTVILSPKVGPTIERDERDHYILFQKIDGFLSATFFQIPPQSFFARVKYSPTNSFVRDSVIEYSESFIFMLAEKINHFEELANGKYRMGSDPAKIEIAIAKDSSLQLLQVERIISDDKPKSNMQSHDGTSASHSNIASEQEFFIYDDVLPFAKDIQQHADETIWSLGFGISYATYSPDYSGINNAFGTIEDKYPNSRSGIRSYNYAWNFSPTLWYQMKIWWKHSLALALNVGSSIEGGGVFNDGYFYFNAVTAEVHYAFKLTGAEYLKPFVGLSIGKYSFEIKRRYDWSFHAGDPTTTFLKENRSAGTKFGFNITTGCEILLDPFPSITLFANYISVPINEATNAEGIKATMDLSSFSFGARVMIYFKLF